MSLKPTGKDAGGWALGRPQVRTEVQSLRDASPSGWSGGAPRQVTGKGHFGVEVEAKCWEIQEQGEQRKSFPQGKRKKGVAAGGWRGGRGRGSGKPAEACAPLHTSGKGGSPGSLPVGGGCHRYLPGNCLVPPSRLPLLQGPCAFPPASSHRTGPAQAISDQEEMGPPDRCKRAP